MTEVNNVTEGKKKLKSLVGFLSANKIDITTDEQKGEKNPTESTEQVKKKNNVFLELPLSRVLYLAGSHSPLCLPRMPSNTMLISGPAVGGSSDSNLVLFLDVLAFSVHSYES